MGERYDIVILGGGVAGCLLANRLSADPKRSVLLVEAGPRDWDPLIRVPIFAGLYYRTKIHNWSYLTEPEPHLDNRRIEWPRGRVLGGSSAINGMVYTRGNRGDYDHWAQLGLRDWSYEKTLPYFKKFEDCRDGANEWHGAGGELPVTRMTTPWPLYDRFVEAGRQNGLRDNDDFNGAEQEGVGRYHASLGDGERWSAARAFVDPARARPNLTVLTKASVLRVVIDKGAATGAELLVRGQRRVVDAGEVIVSCGAISSPTVLMHSGVGDPDELRALGIAVNARSPQVGRNLQDHLNLRLEYAGPHVDELYKLRRFDRAAMAIARALLTKKGPASFFYLQAGAFFRSRPEIVWPDLQVHFVPGVTTGRIRHPFAKAPPGSYDGGGFSGNVCHLRPESRGRIRITSADPLARPAIHANYLATEGDRFAMREGFRRLRAIFMEKAFDAVREKETIPGAQVQSDAQVDAFIRANAGSIYHPVGTCRMGVDADSVLDEKLRVRGVERLRVIDASVMPTLVSANTNAPTMMIAEKGADMVING